MSNCVPRVLVVSGLPFGSEKASGITISSIFAGWPRDALASVYISGSPDRAICARNIEIGAWRWFGILQAARLLMPSRIKHCAREIPGGPTAAAGATLSLRGRCSRFARFLNECEPVYGMSRIDRLVGEFKPCVIYSPLGSPKLIRLVAHLAKRHSVPVVPHFFDDWPSFLYSDNLCWGWPRKVLASELHRLFRHAPGGLCIGEDMAAEYSRRYGVPFEPMMLSIPDSTFDECAPEPQSDALSVAYIGGLHLNRWKSLQQIARILDPRCELRIFTPQLDAQQFAHVFHPFPNVRICSLAPDAVMPEMRRASILLHVESFDPDTVAYARLSVSTKIPQYMAAGRPILAYGPLTLASVALIERSGAGVAVATQTDEVLAGTIDRLLRDCAWRKEMGNRGTAYARTHYAHSVTAKTLRRVFGLAASWKIPDASTE